MNTFKDLMAHDALAVFLNTDEFAEKVEYHPRGGRPRVIAALVDRPPPQQIEGVPRGLAPAITIQVANDHVKGISSAHLDTGGDQIKVALRHGGVLELRSISKLVEHGSAMLTIEVR